MGTSLLQFSKGSDAYRTTSTSREPRSGKTWLLAGSVSANEEPIDVAVREVHEETCLILNPHDLTLLSDARVRVALPTRQQHVYVYTASVPVPYGTSHLRTHALGF
jgi:ADP-ribose pyrophosphatase YjhB (NUDIX family)